tara:strand:+ start:846 stop:1436 length:591 start_codon:yes stop_codon:yes gene_type:complete
MLNILGEEGDFKPLMRYGHVIPYYYVSKDGKILSVRTNKPKILNPQYQDNRQGYQAPRLVGCRVDKREAPELFEEYDYTLSQQSQQRTASDPNSPYYQRLTKDPNKITIQVKCHRAVMETWKPIDEYPPIPKEDWDKTPESAKTFIKDCVIIDHIDSDTTNNHIDNLRWCSQKENQHDRKRGPTISRKAYKPRKKT